MTPQPADAAAPQVPEVVVLCAALGDPTRWQVLTMVGEAARSPSELAEELPVSRQAVAKHLAALEGAGLVEAERHGRLVRYRAIGSRLGALARDLDEVGRRWDARLDRLARLAEEASRPQP